MPAARRCCALVLSVAVVVTAAQPYAEVERSMAVAPSIALRGGGGCLPVLRPSLLPAQNAGGLSKEDGTKRVFDSGCDEMLHQQLKIAAEQQRAADEALVIATAELAKAEERYSQVQRKLRQCGG